MGKSDNRDNQSPIKEFEFVPNVKSSYNKVTVLQSIFPAHIKLAGPVTGKLYEWHKAGDSVSVDDADVAGLLAKRVGKKGCCGDAPDGNKLFQILG